MKSFISWIGGKNLLKKEIVKRFPQDYEKLKYVEVFGGAGWVLFYKNKSSLEIYNDLNSELVNLFRVVKHHSEAFIKECEFMLNSRQEFLEDYRENYNKKYLTDIQRASKFFYKIRYSYGSYGETYSADARKNRINILEHMRQVNERLSSVVVENLDFEQCILKYDRAETLFYLDPPYFSTEHYYENVEFSKEDHKRLRDLLKNVKGKFVLSYNDCEEIRELYKDFIIEEVERLHSLRVRYQNKEQTYKELIIRNY